MPITSRMESQLHHHPNPSPSGVLDSSQGIYDCLSPHSQPSSTLNMLGGPPSFHHFPNNCQPASLMQQRRKMQPQGMGDSQTGPPYSYPSSNNNQYYYSNPPVHSTTSGLTSSINSCVSEPSHSMSVVSLGLNATATVSSSMQLSNSMQSSSNNSIQMSKSIDSLSSTTPSGQKLTYLMQQAMQPLSCDNDKDFDVTFKPTLFESSTSYCSLPKKNAHCFDTTSPTKSASDFLHISPTCTKDDSGISGSQEACGSQKASPPSQGATPCRDIDSPGSTEPTSLPSDSTISHSASDRKCTESSLTNMLDLGDMESSSAVCSGDNQVSSGCSSVTPTTLPSDPSQFGSNTNSSTMVTENIKEKLEIDDDLNEDDMEEVMVKCDDFSGEVTEMSNHLDGTIESVLDRIRAGRGEEVVRFDRPPKESIITQKSSEPNTPETNCPDFQHSPSVSNFTQLNEASSPCNVHANNSPRGVTYSSTSASPCSQSTSSSYMHQRQRTQTALEQTTSTFRQPTHPRKFSMPNQQPSYPGPPPPQGYSPHSSQHMMASQVLPHSNVHMSSPVHQQQHYPPSGYPQHYPSSRMSMRHPPSSHSLYMHPSYQRMPMQQLPSHYYPHQSGIPLPNNYSGQQSPNYPLMPQNRSPLPVNQVPGKTYYSQPPGHQVPPYMQQHSPHQQSLSPNRANNASSCQMIHPQMTQHNIHQSGAGMYPYNRCDGNGGYVSSMQHMTSNRFFNPNASNDFAYTSGQNMHPSNYSHQLSIVPPSFQPTSPFSQSPSPISMMPPPNSNPHSAGHGSGKKRGVDKNKDGPNSKKKRGDNSVHVPPPMTCVNFQLAWKELTTRLQIPSYTSLLQEPLVTPSISLLSPTPGVPLGNVVRGSEAENESRYVLEKFKKYTLAPYHLKHVKPEVSEEGCVEENAYLMENMSTICNPPFIPMGPLLGSGISHRDAATPDNPVCGTPTPSLPSGPFQPPMLNVFSQADLCDGDIYRAPTPPFQLLYPFLFKTSEDSNGNTLTPIYMNNSCDGTPSNKSISEFNDNTSFTDSAQSSICSTESIKLNPAFPLQDSFLFANSSMLRCDVKSGDFEDNKFTIPFSNKNSHSVLTHGAFKQNSYVEEKISISSLTASKKQVSCKQCEMLVVEWQGIRSTAISIDSSELSGKDSNNLFCSVSCLTHYFKKIDNCDVNSKKKTDNTQPVEYSQQLFMGEESSSIKVLLKGPAPKLSKVNLKRHLSYDKALTTPTNKIKRWKDIRWRPYNPSAMTPVRFYKNLSQEEVNRMLLEFSPALSRRGEIDDMRQCKLCLQYGDMPEEASGRMLNLGVDDWLHINCALWCFNVYETISGALVDNEATSYQRAQKTLCVFCGKFGAGLPCYKSRCTSIYHVPCAITAGCMFFTDRGMYCPVHKLTKDHPLYMPDLSATRRIYIDRDESTLIGRALLSEESCAIVRCGSLYIHSVGQLSFHQMASGNFNSPSCIYSVGYKATRIHWSANKVNQRCMYTCTIEVRDQRPLFVLTFSEEPGVVERHESTSTDEVWKSVFQRMANLRYSSSLIRFYPEHIKGDEMFGLTESHVISVLESLPGSEALPNYTFRYGRIRNLTKGRSIVTTFNVSGCARSEGRSVEDQGNWLNSRYMCSRFAAPAQVSVLQGSSTGRQCVVTTSASLDSKYNKAHQFRRLTAGREWEANVYLAQSGTRGMGLFAKKELEKHAMVIEMSGELLRDLVARRREKKYRSTRRLDVLFLRISSEWVLDASRHSNQARYLHHSCEPNCTIEIIVLERRYCMVVSTLRRIEANEELTCDFKIDTIAAREWDSEAEQQLDYSSPVRIPCLCGTANCRKWVN